MVKKRGLGKSLDALLSYTDSDSRIVSEPNVAEQQSASTERLAHLATKQIQRGKYQPRREMDNDALDALASSIRAQGILQPLLVRALAGKPNQYEIIAGERRFRAAQLAGLTQVPVIIRDVPDEAAMAIALIENIQREDLNPIEEASALKRLIEEFGLTHQQVSDAVGKSRASVTNLLRLLILADSVKGMLERGLIEMGHARCLITLPESLQVEAANIIMAKQLSVRETENLVRDLQKPTKPKVEKSIDPDITKLEDSLSRQFRLIVKIQSNQQGKGKLLIHYKNLSELDRLLTKLQEA